VANKKESLVLAVQPVTMPSLPKLMYGDVTPIFVFKKSKTIPVTGLGSLQGCEMLSIIHCLDNPLADGGKVVSPTHLPLFTPQKHYYFSVSGTHFR
jgi:hypothetical protein